MDAVPGGSYLAISQPADDLDPARAAGVEASLNQLLPQKVTFRNPGPADDPALPTIMWGGVARKP